MTALDSAPAAGPELANRRRRGLWWGLLVLAVLLVASLVFGSRPLPLADVAEALWRDNGDPHTIVVEQRIPRTVLAVLVGICLAVAGALMQGLTRNPLADPGLLGVQAGAAFAIVLGAVLVPGAGDHLLVWVSFAGAASTTAVVYLIGNAGGHGRSPVTLVLAGVAVGAVLAGLTSALEILDRSALLAGRSWQAGSLEGADWALVGLLVPFLVGGCVLAAFAARGLNAVALGDDVAAALGSRVWVVRLLVVLAVTVLCGSATAVVGMVWFLGLMVPHVARWLTGPDQRWILAYCSLLGPVLLVGADVVGRVVVIPDEIPAGVVTALVGGPVLIAMVRRTGASGL